MTRVLIMAGGTGGHVFPALAVADKLRQKDVEISWMGTAQGIEAKLVPDAGYTLSEIHVKGLRGNGALGWVLAPFKVIKAVSEARAIIKELKPDVVMGLGGFASGPGGFAAWLMRKPLIIHEQNAIPGLTNRLLAKLADKVLTGFPNTFSKGIEEEWVGNPVRQAIEDLSPPEERQSSLSSQLKVLVLGGSLGARSLNQTIPAALAKLPVGARPQLVHQCGQKHIDDCEQSYEMADVKANIVAFIEDMAGAFEWGDFVIFRAGALTIAEVSAAGVASILVPYPYAVDDHQTYNAEILVDAEAAILMPDASLDADEIARTIEKLDLDRDGLLNMAIAARSVAKTGTAEYIANLCMELTHG